MDRSIDLEGRRDSLTLSSKVNVTNLDNEKAETSTKASQVDIHKDDACWQTEMEILSFKLNIRDWEDFGEDKSPGRFEDEDEIFRNWVCRCCSISVNDTYLKMMNVSTAKKLFQTSGVNVFAEGLCSRLICEKCFELIEKSKSMEGEEIYYSNVRCEESNENTDRTQFEGNEDINNNAGSMLYISEKEQTQLQTSGYINNDNAGSMLRIDRVKSKLTAADCGQTQMTKKCQLMKELPSNKCETCGKFYTCEYYLKGHIARVHNKIKKFDCDLCEYSANNKEYIRSHIDYRHNEARFFNCSFEGCSKFFKTKSDVKRHLVVHFDIRNFICEGCGKSFKRSNDLNKHRRYSCIKRNQATSHATI